MSSKKPWLYFFHTLILCNGPVLLWIKTSPFNISGCTRPKYFPSKNDAKFLNISLFKLTSISKNWRLGSWTQNYLWLHVYNLWHTILPSDFNDSTCISLLWLNIYLINFISKTSCILKYTWLIVIIYFESLRTLNCYFSCIFCSIKYKIIRLYF